MRPDVSPMFWMRDAAKRLIRLTAFLALDALDDTVQVAECNAVPPEGCCDLLDHCPIRAPIGEVHQRIRDVLESVKLVDLFAQSTMAGALQLMAANAGHDSTQDREVRNIEADSWWSQSAAAGRSTPKYPA